jgi:broad specificity phosphatase PhoE
MRRQADRYLFLTRHGEATADESGLSENGRRQAVLLGERLRGSGITAVHHGPLARAAQTARLIGEQLAGVPVRACEAAGDYVPHTPRREELSAAYADSMLERVMAFPAEDRERGPALVCEAVARFTGPVDGDEPVRELVVTHNFLIGWLVRAALDGPAWRWMGLNHANAALTVIRSGANRPPALLVYNDTAHLPAALRWTGLPPELHV